MNKKKEKYHNFKDMENKYQNILENMGEGYFEVDLKGTYVKVNPKYCKIVGYTKKELLGNNFREFFDKKTRAELIPRFRKIYETEIPIPPSARLKANTKRKKTIHFEGSIDLIYDSRGNKVGFYGFTHDISDRVKAEEQLKKAYNLLNILKDVFVHDINNILQNIKSAVQLMNMDLNEKKQQVDKKRIIELTDIINIQIKRAEKISSDVRKISRFDRSNFVFERIDLRNALKTAKNFIIKSFPERNIDIKIYGKKPKYYIKSNDLINNVFENILINAVKYNNKDIVKIEIKISEQESSVKIEFIDNGIGIPGEKKEKIFQSKGKGEENLEYIRSLGIGLSLVKKIILRSKGEIWVEDKVAGDPSQGSKFIVILQKENP
jgi:PAS domain S-box-containing protein